MTGWEQGDPKGGEMLGQMACVLHQDFDLMNQSVQLAFQSTIGGVSPHELDALIQALDEVLATHPEDQSFERLFVSYGAEHWLTDTTLRQECVAFLAFLRARRT